MRHPSNREEREERKRVREYNVTQAFMIVQRQEKEKRKKRARLEKLLMERLALRQK